MALTEPFDILSDFPGWTPVFEPRIRQELSGTAGGRIYTKDFGSPLWTLTASSKSLKANDLDAWRAKLNSLAAAQQTFLGYSLSRCYPIAYPNGSWPTGVSFDGISANLFAIASDNKSIRISSLPSGFALSVGDMLQIGDADLYRVREAAVAASGTTGSFEVFPNLWPGTVTGTAVSVKTPHCLMVVVPGSVSSPADPSTGRGSISFQGIEARS